MTDEEKTAVKKKLIAWGTAVDVCREKQFEIAKVKTLCEEMRSLSDEIENLDVSVDIVLNAYQKAIEELCKDLEECLSEKMYMEKYIRFLDSRQQKILRLRYQDGFAWDYIPMRIGISRKQCFRIHNEAVEKLYGLLKGTFGKLDDTKRSVK